MSNAYSLDLRTRVVAYVLEGGKKTVACHLFQIGRDTLYRWLRQYQTNGHLRPKLRGKYVSRKLNDAALTQYIAGYPDTPNATPSPARSFKRTSKGMRWKKGM